MLADNTPIIIGVGQSVSHWQAGDGLAKAPSPIGMASVAAKRAILDTSARIEIDTLVLVRTMADSLPATQYPLGSPKNAPGAVAHSLGFKPETLIYGGVGGDTPQSFVSEMAEKIYSGTANMALIVGGEATGAMKAARRAGIQLDWSAQTWGECEAKFEDRGFGPALLSDYEMRHGLAFPTQVYALFEEAWRRKNGFLVSEHLTLMSELFEPFSQVAADNPYAQFGKARSAEFLQTVSDENYEISTPYLKWHVAQDAVNQGAAILMTSVGEAKRLGIPEDKWIYLHSSAEARDNFITERPDLSKSQTMELVLNKVLSDSNLSPNDIAHMDLYSCFPCAVIFAAEALGIDWRERVLTVTGGLPFFGAPGNNYSTHAIATLVERLRKNRDAYGLILANGGYLSKQAAGIYSAQTPQNWTPKSNHYLQMPIDNNNIPRINKSPTKAKVISQTISYSKGVPQSGFALCETEKGRCLAKIAPENPEHLKIIADLQEIVTVSISTKNNANFIDLS